MTDVQICNLALARLGDARITTLSDATAQAQYCSLFYAQTLEELQTEFDWQFCRKLASLTANATAPAFGYTRRFAVPTDFLRLIRLNGIDEDENFSKWEIVDGFIHTDLAAPAQIEYIANVTDSTKFPAVFVEILSAKLAANLALPLTGSKELFSQMAEVFSSNVQRPSVKALILATAKDRPSSPPTEDELCRQAILRVGTAEQFGPSSQAMLLAKSLYPQVRDALLLTGSWTWAMKATTVIETIPRPEYKWAYRYAIPSDCLRVFRVNDYDYSTGDSAWEVSGNFVLTNADSGSPAWVIDRSYEVGNAVSNNGVVYRCVVAASTKQPGVTSGWQSDWDIWLGSAIALEYVRKVTDVTAFDSLFIDLLTASLAAKLAVPLTGDANKAALLAKETEVLGKNPAMRRDSTERKGRIKPAWMSSKLVSSRNGGDGIEAQATAGGPAGGVSYPSLLVTVGSVTNLPTGSTPIVTNTGTNDTAVLNFGLPQGPAGTVAVGTTSTSAEGTNASVAATGTPENRILSFTIPRGNKGDAATVAVGSVSTGTPGTTASVVNAGTSAAAVLNFAIPRGDVGATGPANSLSIGTVTAGPTAAATITGTAPNQTLNLTLQQSALLSSAKTTLTGNGTLRTFSVSGLRSSDPNHVIVAINGVTQEPTADYLVNQGSGTITFTSAIPNGAKIVVVALGLYSPATQRDPDNYIHAFALNTAGTFSYYGLLLNSDIPATGSAAAVAKWSITRSALTTAGAVTATAKATNVAWTNRETATYA